MGTDIHTYIEYRDGDAWHSIDDWDDSGERISPEYGGGRDYWTFAILADVRNGHGFAGVDRGDPVPFLEVKGLPDDASHEVGKEFNECWALDAHSTSYLTLAELLRFPWHQTFITKRAWISGDEIKRHDKLGDKDSYRPWAYFGALPDSPHPKKARKITWRVPATEECQSFLAEVLPVMGHVMVTRGIGLDDVRIVFWFDN